MDAGVPQAALYENGDGLSHSLARLGSSNRGNRLGFKPGALSGVKTFSFNLPLQRTDGIKLLADIAGKVCLGTFDFRCDRVADDEVYADDCREVEDHIRFAHHVLQFGGVDHIGFGKMETRVVPHGFYVARGARGKIVDGENFMSVGKKIFREMSADEAGAAGDQILHHASFADSTGGRRRPVFLPRAAKSPSRM